MNGRIPVTNEDYRRLTQLFLLFLGVNANLVKNGWDENSNHDMYVYITTVVLVLAQEIQSLLLQIETGNKSEAVKALLAQKKPLFNECVKEMYHALEISQKSAETKAEAYEGLGFIQPSPHKPYEKSQVTNATELVTVTEGHYTRLLIFELQGNTETHSHKLEHGQDHRKIEWGYVDFDDFDYTDEKFNHYIGTNKRHFYEHIPAEEGTGLRKIIVRARIVSKNREEGPAGPVFEKGISKWNIEEEKRKDAEAIARAKAAVEAAHLAAIRAANAEAAKKQAESKGSGSGEKQG